MIKRLIKYISSIVKPTVNDTTPHKQFFNNQGVSAKHDELQNMIDQREFCDYPTLTDRRKS